MSSTSLAPFSASARFPFIYLASQSPRRLELLGQLGVAVEMLLADADEDVESLEAPIPGEHPLTYVRRVTLAKALAARDRLARRGLPCAPILAADTTVAVDSTILGKPSDAADATRMLSLLAGRQHQVLTAVAVVTGHPAVAPAEAFATQDTTSCAEAADSGEPPAILAVNVSDVRFTLLDAQQIAHYVASGEPFGKAGAYGIQGRAAEFIAHLSGSYSGVMGLPLFETAALLRQAGIAF